MADPHDIDEDARLEKIVGHRVRQYRIAAGLTAAELAVRAGLSPAMISRIESASISSSLTTIHRLATALEVPVASLFRGVDAPHSAIVVRAGRGAPVARAGSSDGHLYWALGSLLSTVGPSIEPVMVELNAAAESFPLYEHAGIEFLYMVAGSMEFVHGDERHVLEPGDSVLLDAEAPHGPVRVIDAPARFLSVNPTGS